MNLVVVNEEKLTSTGPYSEISIQLDNSSFIVDFFFIQLDGCDAVLVAQWLRTLGPIIWDIEKMKCNS